MNPNIRRLLTVLAALVLLFAASAAAYGYFVDTEQGTGNVTAANSFGGNGGPNPGQSGTPGAPGGTPGNGGSNPGQSGTPGNSAAIATPPAG